MKTALSILFVLFVSNVSVAGEPIDKPVLLAQAGKAGACLEQQMLRHFTPGESVIEWRGPGVRADGAGTVDPSTAVYIFRLTPTNRWFGLALYSADDDGWRIFTYTDANQKLAIGYRARSMESIGYLFGVKPREFSTQRGDELDYEEIDLTPCKDLFRYAD